MMAFDLITYKLNQGEFSGMARKRSSNSALRTMVLSVAFSILGVGFPLTDLRHMVPKMDTGKLSFPSYWLSIPGRNNTSSSITV
jgi:hypothetical protein